MTIIYKCDKCEAEFRNPHECRMHEAGHFHGIDKIKYDLIHNQEENICDYCDDKNHCDKCIYQEEEDKNN